VSPGNILELLIILVIVVGIGAAIWRGGARNPVGTGGLDKKLTALSGELKAMNNTIGTKIAGVEGKVDEIETRLEAVERDAIGAADIKRIEKAIDRLAKAQADIESRQRALSDKQGEHAATSAATAATVQQIAEQVRLIMSVVVPKGMEK
jgi:hypothetical protein